MAEGMRAALKVGALAGQDLDALVMIVSVWIDWAATDEATVLRNTREAIAARVRPLPGMARCCAHLCRQKQ